MVHGGLSQFVAMALSSGVAGGIAKWAWDQFGHWRQERRGEQTAKQNILEELSRVKTVARIMQVMLIEDGRDKRSIPSLPGEDPLSFLECPTNPDVDDDDDEEKKK